MELISEDSALLSYEYTFFIYGIINYIFLAFKEEKLVVKEDASKTIAAILETAGQFFYVFAMADDSVIGATVIGSYFILALLLSSIFLKERLSIPKYIGIFITSIGIITLLIMGL